MSTNDTEVEDTTTTTEDDEKLRQDLKEALANDSKPAAEEPDKAPNAEGPEEAKEEAPAEPEAPLTTQEPEHDLAWYKTAYEQSTTEALRLKGELDKKVEPPVIETLVPPTDEILTPDQLYIRQKRQEEIDAAFNEITDKYPSIKDPDTYKRFTAEANLVGKVIVESQKRSPSPKELYEKTAVILGLTPDSSEALSAALKDSAGTPRTPSSIPGPTPKSKVTEEMIAMNQKMYPGKTRQQIIEELEPYIT